MQFKPESHTNETSAKEGSNNTNITRRDVLMGMSASILASNIKIPEAYANTKESLIESIKQNKDSIKQSLGDLINVAKQIEIQTGDALKINGISIQISKSAQPVVKYALDEIENIDFTDDVQVKSIIYNLSFLRSSIINAYNVLISAMRMRIIEAKTYAKTGDWHNAIQIKNTVKRAQFAIDTSLRPVAQNLINTINDTINKLSKLSGHAR